MLSPYTRQALRAAPVGTRPVSRYRHERDQHLAGESDNGDALDAALDAAHAGQEPTGQVTAGLMAHPQPGQFDHGRPRPRVAGFADALIVSQIAAGEQAWRQSDIGRDIAPVGELPVEHLVIQHRRDLRPDAFKLGQRADPAVRFTGRFVGFDDGVALRLDGPDQLEQKLQALELSARSRS